MNVIGKNFIEALQSDNIKGFIADLNKLLIENYRNEVAWLYLARSFEIEREIDKAKNAYVNLMRFSQDTSKYVDEIASFSKKHNIDINIAKLNDPSPSKGALVRSDDNEVSTSGKDILETPDQAQIANHRSQSTEENKEGQIEFNDISPSTATPGNKVFTGFVKNYNSMRGFGFITYDNRDIFVHFTNIIADGSRYLERGQRVTFQLENTPKGIQAINVRRLETITSEMQTGEARVPKSAIESSNRFRYLPSMDPAFAKRELEKEYRKYPTDIKVAVNYVAVLQRLHETAPALDVINKSLETFTSGADREKFLVPKAQILTALDHINDAEAVYSYLVEISDVGSPKHAHFLEQLARIQLKSGKFKQALSAAKEAQKIVPDNILTRNLVTQIEQYIYLREADETLRIDLEEEQLDAISPMLRIDIEEYDYRDEQILKRGTKPTIDDCIRIESSLNKDEKLAPEKYPLYLELAKAYKDLPPGSYDTTSLQSALAHYAVLRGTSIYNKYLASIQRTDFDHAELQIMKDSASSYFLEALNLQIVGERPFLDTLSNYLKVQLLHDMLSKKYKVDKLLLTTRFADIFKLCMQHQDRGIYKTLLRGVVSCGATNISIWNKFSKAKEGFDFFGLLWSEKQRSEMYQTINEIEGYEFDITLKPGLFFKSVFDRRREMAKALFGDSYKFQNIQFSPQNIKDVINKWSLISQYDLLLSDTDRHLYEKILGMLKLFEPYLIRSSEERTNILYRTRIALEEVITFIEENTTYWGRTVFYPNLQKWRRSVDEIEKSRLTQTLPNLKISLDSQFFKSTNNVCEVTLLIRNIGGATAESAKIDYNLMYLDSSNALISGQESIDSEISPKHQLSYVLRFSGECLQSTEAATISMSIHPIYEGKLLPSSDYSFTIEKESQSTLAYQEIPWDETRIPSKELFKGRDRALSVLFNHLSSSNRNKTYILWGLTRTGKSSILRYLSEMIDLKPVNAEQPVNFISFIWDLSKAAAETRASDMWSKLLVENCNKKIADYAEKGEIDKNAVMPLKGEVRFKDWERLLRHLSIYNLYPVFLVDEFSFYKQLVDQRRVDSAFLASIRSFAIDGLASFIFAGTYDLKDLIKDPDYGITGQLVNTVEMPISQIDSTAACDLIKVMGSRLQFTEAAVDRILNLSNRIPYFIQIICKNCGYYAAEAKRKVIGSPEVEQVVKILTGEERKTENSLLGPLSPGVFMNNQYSPQDSKEVGVLVSTITYLNKGSILPRGVRYEEILKLWSQKKVTGFNQKIADCLDNLKAKGILIEEEDEASFVYRIGVDLFRRWWAVDHGNIELQLASLRDE